MGIVNEAGMSNDGMRTSWSFDASDTHVVLDRIWLVEEGEYIKIFYGRPIASDNVVLTISTGAIRVVFFCSSRGRRLVDATDEEYLVGIERADSMVRREQKRLQQELDTRLHVEYQTRIDAQNIHISNILSDNPLINNFEEMSGIKIDRRFTGSTAYGLAVDWGRMGTHSVVKVMFDQKRKIQCERVPTLSQSSIKTIGDAIELLDTNPTGSDILIAVEVVKSL